MRELAIRPRTARCTDDRADRPRSTSSSPRSTAIGTRTTFAGDPASSSRGRRPLTFQVGANAGRRSPSTTARRSAAATRRPRLDRCCSVVTAASATASIAIIDSAIAAVSHRSGEPSVRCRTASSTPSPTSQAAEENLTASESRIRDTDMAQEMVQFTRTRSSSRPAPPCWPRPTRSPRASCRCSASSSGPNSPPATTHRSTIGPFATADRSPSGGQERPPPAQVDRANTRHHGGNKKCVSMRTSWR